MLAQAYGSRGDMPSKRSFPGRYPNIPGTGISVGVNFSYIFFALCVAGTSASTQANVYFYPGITLLVMVALTWSRPRRVGAVSLAVFGARRRGGRVLWSTTIAPIARSAGASSRRHHCQFVPSTDRRARMPHADRPILSAAALSRPDHLALDAGQYRGSPPGFCARRFTTVIATRHGLARATITLR